MSDGYERQRRYERRQASLAADVGDLPPVVNPKRRAACERDLERFLVEYFPASTGLSPFSADHKRVIGRIQGSVLDGGLFANIVYRGFAKTTIAENSTIWASAYGHRKFVPIFGADADAAGGNIESIKLELAENDLLYDDFPEICHPVRCLEGKSQRCASQTHTIWGPCEKCGSTGKVLKEGASGPPREVKCDACGGAGRLGDPQLTHIGWTSDTIVLPTVRLPKGWGTIKGVADGAGLVISSAAGGIITARGIMGGSRGMKHKRPDGTQQRPDFVLIDDPQTDESASTPLQVNKRLNTIRKSILKLGGHDRRIAVVMNATVIKPDDLVEQVLDAKKFPAWQGERIKMVRAWAKEHETLWLGDYARLRNTYDPNVLGDQQRAHKEATEFYRRNRKKMDAGCQVSWEHCFQKGTELSAIQHAYNALIDDGEEVFASECQNDPIRARDDNEETFLSADQIAQKLNQLPRGDLPLEASRVVAYVDVQKTMLFWMVVAFTDGFTGWVVDYGAWPEQRRSYFAAKDAKPTLMQVTKAASLQEAIYSSLDALTAELMAREWKRADGAVLKIERQAIDANWGESTDTVYQFCRQSPHASALLPSHGQYVGARSRPFRDYRNRPGDKTGLSWRMPTVQNKRTVRYLLIDTNFWKSFALARLSAPLGRAGCISLFGEKAETHKLLADHLTSEKGTKVEAHGRSVVEFEVKPRRENHWFDCYVGCCVVASVQGVTLPNERPSVKRARRSIADAQKGARHYAPKN